LGLAFQRQVGIRFPVRGPSLSVARNAQPGGQDQEISVRGGNTGLGGLEWASNRRGPGGGGIYAPRKARVTFQAWLGFLAQF